MKKFFTLTIMALLVAVGANAQDRKTWDFTKGFSATTIANLEADEAGWTKSESGSKKWAESKARTGSTEASCKVNGETWIIPETQGVIFHAASAKHLNIVYAEGSDDTHVWLNGAKGEDAVTIPNVPAGEKLTVTFSSHGGKAERGFKVSTAGVADAEGQTQFTSAGQMTVELINSNAEMTNVKLSAVSGGIHFYKFIIGEGDEATTTKVAYLYNGTEDNVLAMLQANELYEVTPINVTSETVTSEGLQQYALTIIGASVPADNAAVAVVKEALPWTPFLNFNANLYPVWGYGEAVAVSEFMQLKDKKHTFVKSISADDITEEEEGRPYITFSDAEDGSFGVTLGDYFAGDVVIGSDYMEETSTVFHAHNLTHNGYVFLANSTAYAEVMNTVLQDYVIPTLVSSKADVSAAAAPKLKLEYKDLNTNIIITAPNLPKAAVYYTTDGSEPTLESTLYTAPINVTAETTIKAIAIAEGYTKSSVAEITADIKTQPKTPTMSYEQEEGKTTVTLACESTDADIWYNFESTTTTDTTKSTKYVEPFVITMPQTVTIFSVAGQAVWSEVAQQRVLVKNPRVVIDVAGHYSAAQWDNISGGSSVFSYGKNGTSQYVGEGTPGTDPDTGDETIIYGPEDLREYEVKEEPGETPAWAVYGRGEGVLWESITTTNVNFGDDSNYNPSTSEDVDPLFPITKNDLSFYKVVDEPNAFIRSLTKYQGPLDVVLLAGMPGGVLEIQVSTDGENWTTIGDRIEKTGFTRMWKKYTRSYDGTDEVFVRVAKVQKTNDLDKSRIFDIYVANQGEKSQALLAQINEELTGIADVKQATKAAAGIYGVNGMRQQSLKRGLNIIVEDGAARKVYVK